MKTLLVDDNQLSLDILHEICAASPFAEIVGEFTDPMEALDFVGKNPVDFALLDVEMPKMSGIDLGKKFRALYPKIVLIYVTGHEDAYIDAMRMKADFYVCKPFDREDILEAIDRAQLLSARQFKQTMILPSAVLTCLLRRRSFISPTRNRRNSSHFVWIGAAAVLPWRKQSNCSGQIRPMTKRQRGGTARPL